VQTSAAPRDAYPLGIAAISALAYVLCDLLHETAHALTTLLPLGVNAVAVSTIGVSSFGESALVAAAGPLVNVASGLALLLACSATLSAAARYASWLFGSISLFNGTAYLLYSAALGSGDWAVVFNAFAPPPLWRPLAGLAGAALYAAAVLASARGLRHLVASCVVAVADVERYCWLSYWVGGAVLVAGSLFNPVSPWLILTSGVATGFGAMAGLLALPVLLRRVAAGGSSSVPAWHVGWPWLAAGGVASLLFVGLFGPGIRLGS